MQQTSTKSFWIPADWPAPENIHAGTTTRIDGFSNPPYSSLNLAKHVGDDPVHVSQNRRQVVTSLGLPSEPAWLEQVHGNTVIDITTAQSGQPSDGAYTDKGNAVCVVLTADCLPLLITDINGKEIAAIHVGWRGFGKNIISSALSMFSAKPEKLLAWTGPYIHAEHYEVGKEVREACLNVVQDATGAFRTSRESHWYANLELLVRSQLEENGIREVFGSDYCTYRNTDLFYSHRRDGITGRTACMIWMDSF